jgi:hypothetical protein
LRRTHTCPAKRRGAGVQVSPDPGVSWWYDACNGDLSIPFERT